MSAGENPTTPHIPDAKPHQRGAAVGTLPIFPPAPSVPRECAPTTRAGTADGEDVRRPRCPPWRQTRLAALSKIRALLQAPFALRK